MELRIYTYKITFEEVPYYYYGSKKEKRYDEYYMGSPKTNRWCWELYTPKKQILELFDYTNEGYEKCRRVEDRLIKFVLNDPWCLNERCSNFYSTKASSEGGKKALETNRKNKTGIHGLTKEQKIQNSKKGGKKAEEINKRNKTGLYGLTFEQKSKGGKIVGNRNKELGLGIFALTPEQIIENASKGGKIVGNRNKELGLGICGLTKDQRSETAKKVCSQRWQCTETGHISNSGGLSKYQKAKGIDTSNRIRIE